MPEPLILDTVPTSMWARPSLKEERGMTPAEKKAANMAATPQSAFRAAETSLERRKIDAAPALPGSTTTARQVVLDSLPGVGLAEERAAAQDSVRLDAEYAKKRRLNAGELDILGNAQSAGLVSESEKARLEKIDGLRRRFDAGEFRSVQAEPKPLPALSRKVTPRVVTEEQKQALKQMRCEMRALDGESPLRRRFQSCEFLPEEMLAEIEASPTETLDDLALNRGISNYIPTSSGDGALRINVLLDHISHLDNEMENFYKEMETNNGHISQLNLLKSYLREDAHRETGELDWEHIDHSHKLDLLHKCCKESGLALPKNLLLQEGVDGGLKGQRKWDSKSVSVLVEAVEAAGRSKTTFADQKRVLTTWTSTKRESCYTVLMELIKAHKRVADQIASALRGH